MKPIKYEYLFTKPVFIILFLLILVGFLFWQNNAITTNNLKYKSDRLPDEFKGFKILHISDLHNKEFGNSQKELIKKTNKIDPDVIFITGDIIDSRRTSEDEIYIAMNYVKEAVKIAPVYYVSGNHEFRSGFYNEIKVELKEAGVNVLDNDASNITLGKDTISIMGLSDITFSLRNYKNINIQRDIEDKLSTLKLMNNDNFSILLSHRPELISSYAASNMDIVFSGHAHGGQIKLPFIGGLIAPDQGLFPKYTEGMYVYDDTSLIVSRGLGNSLFPFRIFNRPELVVVTLDN